VLHCRGRCRRRLDHGLVGCCVGVLLFTSLARHPTLLANCNWTVASRFGPKRGFGVTPGELLTIRVSKPDPYPKSEKPPGRQRPERFQTLKSPRWIRRAVHPAGVVLVEVIWSRRSRAERRAREERAASDAARGASRSAKTKPERK